MALETKRDHDAIELMASAAHDTGEDWLADGTGDSHRLPYQVNAFCFTLDVTAAESILGDTLAVYIQTKLDGSNWTDVARFAAVTGNGGAVRRIIRHTAQIATAEFEVGTGLAAAAVRNLHGDEWRVRWHIERGCSVSAAFTFSVTAIPM